MGRAEQCISCSIHWIGVVLVMSILVYGFNAGDAMARSGAILTGSAVASDWSEGYVVLKNQALWYQQLIAQDSVIIEQVQRGANIVLIISGSNKEVLDAVIKVASQAERRGDLVSYSMYRE